MYRWYGLDDVPADWAGCVATIGVFDGVHRGHQRIVARAGQVAREHGPAAGRDHLRPAPGRGHQAGLASAAPHHPPPAGRAAGGLGADAVFVLPFTVEFSRLSPDEFVRAVLVERLHAAAVVVGEDFRFGHRAAGDVPLLGQLGEKYDFTAEGVPLLVDGRRCTISSTPSGSCWTPGT